jgi:hypothetical protein
MKTLSTLQCIDPAKTIFTAGVTFDEVPIVTPWGIIHLPADGHVFLKVT